MDSVRDKCTKKTVIEEFFENREIFITGGSGVVGRALMEKLLRSCNVRKIYVLLRPKANISLEERLEKLKTAMVFHQLKLQKPHELDHKLVAIPGDITMPFLGIKPEHQKILENVSVVFHSAATVRFNEPLRDVIKINVGGTLQALKFSETLKNLQVFMYISTFFSNPYLKFVEEKVYDSPMDWNFCLNLSENKDIPEEQLDAITKKLIVGFPNTYSFTKNLTESLVNDYRFKLPVAIYRPSIVIFALEEPEPGFSPTLMGAMGLFALTGAGVMKTFYLAKESRMDFTSQDIGIKTLCYYTLKTAQFYKKRPEPNEAPVYIVSSCTHCDLLFSQFLNIMQDYGFWTEAAVQKSFLIPGLHYTDSRFLFLLLVFCKHLLPALVADLALILSGHKAAFLGVHRRLFVTTEALKPFFFNNYESLGITYVNEMLNTFKGTEFSVDILPSLKQFYRCIGLCEPVAFSIRKHLFEEDPKTLARSRKILKAKIFTYNIIKFLLAFNLFKYIQNYIKNM